MLLNACLSMKMILEALHIQFTNGCTHGYVKKKNKVDTHNIWPHPLHWGTLKRSHILSPCLHRHLPHSETEMQGTELEAVLWCQSLEKPIKPKYIFHRKGKQKVKMGLTMWRECLLALSLLLTMLWCRSEHGHITLINLTVQGATEINHNNAIS